MKKIYVFMLMLLLIGQTILGPMGTVMAQEPTPSESFTLKEGALTGTIAPGQSVKLTYKWNLSEEIVGSNPAEMNLPEQLTAEDQSDVLMVGDKQVGSYSMIDNKLSVTFEVADDEGSDSDAVGNEEGDKDGGEDDNNGTPVGGENEDDGTTDGEEVETPETEEDGSETPGDESGADSDADGTEETDGEQSPEEDIVDRPSAKTPKNHSTNALAQDTTPFNVEGEGTITIQATVNDDAEGEFSFGGSDYTVGKKESVSGQDFILKLNKLTDLNGNEMDSLKITEEFKLHLAWELENGHSFEANDKKTIQLPPGIKIQQQFSIELKDGTGAIVANATVNTDNSIHLTFTEYVETHSNVTGFIEITSMIDQNNVEIDDGDIVLRPIGEEGELRIPVDMSDREKTIEKQGTPNKGYNADEISWTVTINKMQLPLTGAKVIDTLPAGTEYKEGSLKVTKLLVDLNGNIKGEQGRVSSATESISDGNITIALGNTSDAYRIEYVTTVKDEEKKEFKNDATLKDDSLSDVSADATVTINRGEPIKKSAVTNYNPKTGIVGWEIQFNYNQKDLQNVILKDEWKPVGKMDYVEGSLQFQEVTIDKDGKATDIGLPVDHPEGASLVVGADQFEVNGISTDKAYKVTYQTKVRDRVLDGFDVSNTAGFGSWSDGAGRHVGAYYGSKSAGDVDYEKKTIDWKIEINHDEYPMENIRIEDNLGAGLTLIEDSLKVTVDGAEYTSHTLSVGKPFTIEFTGTIDKKIVITYKTKYVADLVPDYRATNIANITWTPEGKSDPITKEVNDGTNLNRNTSNNHWKNGSYSPDTKEITWTIYTNYRENQINELIVEDKPQGNQRIDIDSVVVKELAIAAGGGITEGKVVDVPAIVDTAANSLTVNIGETDKAYKIEYKTSIAGLNNIQKEYVNKAEVFDGGTSPSNIEAKVGIAKAYEYGDKSGTQDDKQIHWSVTVNPGQQQLTNLLLTDEISENQEYLIDTVKVYEASVDTDGNATKKGELASSAYELTHVKGEPTFTIKWNSTVERAFVVEYSTLFFAKDKEDVTNSYEITADHIVKNGETGGGGLVTVRQYGSGGGAGEVGYLVVAKYGTTEGEDTGAISGVEFELLDASSKKVLKTGETNGNGEIDFGRLLFGKYILKEVKAPEGYVGIGEREVEINAPYVPGNEIKGQIETVENKKVIRSFELTKTDEHEGNPLPGVKFKLQKEVNGQFETVDEHKNLETNADGKIRIDDLAAGNYQLIETETLSTHWLDESPVEFTITDSQTEAVKKNMTNFKIGELIVEKVDAEDGKFLNGAKFELVNKADSELTYDATTELDGIAKFTGVKYGTYILKESTPPAGYVGMAEDMEVKVDSPTVKLSNPIKNEKIKQAVKLTKIDVETKALLDGAVFVLYNDEGDVVKDKEGNKIRRATKNGILTVNNLEPGSYYFVEETAPEYYLADDSKVEFTIVKDQVLFTPVTKENKHGTGNLEVTKKDEDDDKLLEGAEFTLTNKNDENQSWMKVTKDGIAHFTDIPYGTYILTETQSPEGYADKGYTKEIIINDPSTNNITVKDEVENKKLDRSFKLIKTEYRNDKRKLKGAEFELRLKNDEGIFDVVPGKEKLVTDENGEIDLPGLDVGEYQLIETKAPSGYVLDKKPLEFTIEQNQTEGKSETFENRKVSVPPSNPLGGIKIVKVDAEDTSKRLEGAKFAIKSGNTVISEITTDSLGIAIDNFLPYGEYTIEEVEAPAGYELSTKTIEVNVNSIATIEVQIENKQAASEEIGGIQIVKVDGDEPNKRLAGAVFSLHDGDGLVTEVITDENGIAQAKNLPYGKYIIKEIKAPSGYEALSKEIQVTVDKVQMIEVRIDNVKLTDPPTTDPGTPTDPPTTDPGTPTDPPTTDPVKPGKPTEPGNPGEEDPSKPGTEDPNKPGTEDPNKPGTEDPTKSGTEDPNKPGTEDPNKPGTEDSTKPGTEDPNKPGTEDPTKPGQPGEEDPNDPNTPTDSSTTDPTDPNKPGANKPSTPGNNGYVEGQEGNKGNTTGKPGSAGGSKGQQSNVSGKDTLPQTGEELYLYMTIFGLVLILAGGFMVRRRKINE